VDVVEETGGDQSRAGAILQTMLPDDIRQAVDGEKGRSGPGVGQRSETRVAAHGVEEQSGRRVFVRQPRRTVDAPGNDKDEKGEGESAEGGKRARRIGRAISHAAGAQKQGNDDTGDQGLKRHACPLRRF